MALPNKKRRKKGTTCDFWEVSFLKQFYQLRQKRKKKTNCGNQEFLNAQVDAGENRLHLPIFFESTFIVDSIYSTIFLGYVIPKHMTRCQVF